MNNLYTITSKVGGQKIKFKPNAAQQAIFAFIKENKRVLLLKSRQLGATTGLNVYFLDDTLFTRNLNAVSLFHNRDKAIDAFDNKVRFAWENMNEELKQRLGWLVDTERANQLTFGFGDKTYSSYSVATSGRSGTFQRVHISEFGPLCAERPLDAKEIITGTFPAVPQDGLIVIETTAAGETGYFAEMWKLAIEGKNGWKTLFLNWRYDTEEIDRTPLVDLSTLPDEFIQLGVAHELSHKELSYYFSKFLMLNRDWALLRQEYPTTAEEAFQGSGEKMFDMEAITEYEKHIEEGTSQGDLRVFEPYQYGKAYVVGGDPAEGIEKDHSAAAVWKVDGIKPKLVAEYTSNTISPEDFAYVMRKLAVDYGYASVAPENNNYAGGIVVTILKQIYREDLIYRQIDEVKAHPLISPKLGFGSTSMSKPFILSTIVQATKDRDLQIPSRALLAEMRICPKSEMIRVVKKGVTNHFDLLMASAIGLHARQFALEHCGKATISVTTSVHQPEEFDPFAAV